MALAGAGNPVGGSNPTGTGAGLNYIGGGELKGHAYGYSGSVTSTGGDSADTIVLKFQIGSGEYFEGVLRVSSEFTGNETRHVTVNVNGSNVITIKADGEPSFYECFPAHLILAPFDDVEIKVGVNGGGGFNAAITGRMYA